MFFCDLCVTKMVCFRPGVLKTTLVKKIAWDWAKKLFTKVTVVFFVFLKLVNPDDTIENVIIDQTPELEGLGVTTQKLKNILENYGEKSLLILDGLDEHAFGKNKDVLKIVKHQKYLFCNVLLTSRPHSTRDIEKYFDTIVKVEGFTQTEARKFALRIVPEEKKVDQVLNFNPTDLKESFALYNCPILLSFLCILVREDNIDLSSTEIPLGEIYTRMVRCLYKKYCIRKGIEFEESKLTAVLKLIGSLALKTLVSGNPLMKRSDVIREVGDDPFAYGLLIGHEDFRVIRDETADILITFAHRSIQEFLGSFCFIYNLNDGQTIESLLGADCPEPVFMVNPLFLHFCLWLVSSSEKYVALPNRETVSNTLLTYMLSRTYTSQLHISAITRLYSAVDFKRAVKENDELSLIFFGSFLERIDKVKSLTIRADQPIDWLLTHLHPAFTDLTLLRLCSKRYTSAQNRTTFIGLISETLPLTLPQFTTSTFCDKYLNIVLTDEIFRSEQFKKVLSHCKFLDRPPAVYLYLQSGNRTELTNLLHKDLHKIHVLSTHAPTVTFTREVMRCPFLSHLSIVGRFDKKIFLELNRAVQSRNLPQLTHLSFAGIIDQLPSLFHPVWSSLRYLNLYGCQLSSDYIRTLLSLKTESRLRSDAMFGRLTCLTMIWVTVADATVALLREVLDQRERNNLTELNLSIPLCSIKTLKPELFAELTILRLEGSIKSPDDLKHLSNTVKNLKLQILDISHSSGITGTLSTLVGQTFPCLTTLVLSDCGLNSEDLRALAKGNVEGRLPELRHLDISRNIEDFDSLFSSECKWDNLVSINIRNDFSLDDSLKCLEAFVKLGCLCSLETLRFYVDAAKKVCTQPSGTKWPKLVTLEIVSTLKDIEYALTYARRVIKTGSFPELRTVCVVVKPNTASIVERDEDRSDMSWLTHEPTDQRGHPEGPQLHKIDDKKYAEALYALKSLGVAVHVWFSGDEQFTKKAGVM